MQLAFPGFTFNLSLYIMAAPPPLLSSHTSCTILKPASLIVLVNVPFIESNHVSVIHAIWMSLSSNICSMLQSFSAFRMDHTFHAIILQVIDCFDSFSFFGNTVLFSLTFSASQESPIHLLLHLSQIAEVLQWKFLWIGIIKLGLFQFWSCLL